MLRTAAWRAAALVVLTAGCTDAWGQSRHDAGVHSPTVHHRDAGAPDVVQLPPTHGTIDPLAARQVIQGQGVAVRRCYTAAIAHDATLHGHIEVRLRVETDGTVSETSTGGDDSLRSVGHCIEMVFKRVQFPRPTGGAATVTAPFVFAADG